MVTQRENSQVELAVPGKSPAGDSGARGVEVPMSTDDLGPLPRIHPRRQQCVQARLDIEKAILEITQKHELTEAESLMAINGACSGQIGHIIKYAIRRERHGDEDKPGGWA